MEGAADFFDDDDGSKMDVEGADDDDDAGTYGDEGTEARVMFNVGVVVAIAAIVAVVVFVVVATFLFWGRVQKHTSASV